MAAYTNQSGGMLILPNGTEIKAGDSAEISADVAKNVGVSQWVKDEWLVKGKAKAEKEADAKAKADAEAARADLVKQAEELKIKVEDDMSDDDLKSAIDAALAT
jgi:hypothetical protein